MNTPPAQCEVSFTVNGTTQIIRAYPMERLLDVLRRRLGLTGPKEGCGEGECGSCSVLMDGMLVNSCLVPLLQAQGARIVTVEGLAKGPQLHALQHALLACGGAQCGICTPGFLMAALHLLNERPQPTVEEIKEGLAGNLCRCTGYAQICEAVAEVAVRETVRAGVLGNDK
ncbi:MAG TPA: (2Fe-2S)-binding protein [Candidatus Sulfotelmatobacter sp.]|jgi:aerobic carbon-monoxide dehydrogenase small subunit|nr:(2Fe-2S)-binding protein [Candidatus Sulfotelmatobacter sp.]